MENTFSHPYMQPVPEEINGKMRQFLRVLMSYGDFKHAKLASTYILDNHLHAGYPAQSYIILEALNCSMIMAYCRPFSGNSPSVPDLPRRFLSILDDDEREVHEIVLHDRNKLLAHSDHEGLQMEPVLWRVGDKEMLVPITNWALAPLSESATKTLASAIAKLLQATMDERSRLELEVTNYLPRVEENGLTARLGGAPSPEQP